MHIYICIYIHIYKGLRPLPPTPDPEFGASWQVNYIMAEQIGAASSYLVPFPCSSALLACNLH